MIEQGKQHNNNMKIRGDKVTHGQGEQVKIPLLPNKVRKKERDNVHDNTDTHFGMIKWEKGQFCVKFV